MTAARPYVGATAKFVHVSPRKARLVVDHIRGRSVPEARTILKFMERAAAHEVEKVLHSAVSNAESNPNLRWDGDELFISAVYVDEGPTLKRWRARARGRVNQILKRTCHITIKVEKLEEVAPASPTGTTAEKTRSRKASGGAASASKSKKSPKKKEVAA
jgi:large subunit ribosomal protein L22